MVATSYDDEGAVARANGSPGAGGVPGGAASAPRGAVPLIRSSSSWKLKLMVGVGIPCRLCAAL